MYIPFEISQTWVFTFVIVKEINITEKDLDKVSFLKEKTDDVKLELIQVIAEIIGLAPEELQDKYLK